MASPSTPVAGTPFFKIDHASLIDPVSPALVSLDPFYPIVPDTNWLARLLARRIKLVQLRIKNEPRGVVQGEIKRAIRLCAVHRCQLVVNDYWREAIDLGADFVHLGQGDLAAANLRAIRAARRQARHQHA